jgi:hypothetical protein
MGVFGGGAKLEPGGPRNVKRTLIKNKKRERLAPFKIVSYGIT